MTTITINAEKNGIEIRFDSKPSSDVLAALKELGFRWSKPQKMWWAKNTDERMEFARSLENGAEIKKQSKAENKPYDLFALTRTDEIEDNWSKYRIFDCKEIAAIIRKHIRSRFPMCKWSVTSDVHSISVKMKSSPWDRESPEVNAIADYVHKFAQSYNYDHSDSMTDYFDVNFYGVYRSDIISRYNYEQREETVAEHSISEQFRIDLAAFEKAEAERKEREFQERLRQAEIDRQRAAEIEKCRAAEAVKIEENYIAEDCDMWVLNVQLVANKESNLNSSDDEYYTDHSRVNCKVSRKVMFTEEIYNLFVNHLITDFSFLEQMGGSATDDKRVNSDEDYRRMSKEERESVEWYNINCVAIYCDDVLKLVIDPQGFNYARYVYQVDDKSEVTDDYSGNTGISEEEANENKASAEILMNAINDIFVNNEYCTPEKIINDSFDMFRLLMIETIEANRLRFDTETIREIENESIKVALYRVLNEPIDIQRQFSTAHLTPGQRITVIQISDFGMMATTRAVYKGYEKGSYAQYDRAVKLLITPERKRGLYSKWLYRDVLIYDGFLTIPDDVLWDVQTNESGVTTKMTKFLSCDPKQYDEIIKYFKEKGLKPIINTYKPVFG